MHQCVRQCLSVRDFLKSYSADVTRRCYCQQPCKHASHSPQAWPILGNLSSSCLSNQFRISLRYVAVSLLPIPCSKSHITAFKTPGRSRVDLLNDCKPPNLPIPWQRMQHRSAEAPSSSHTSPQNDIQEARPFTHPRQVALNIDGKGPPYYVVIHGTEPGIYTDWCAYCL